MTTDAEPVKRETILEVARELGAGIFTPAEIEQIRRQLAVRHADHGKTSPEYIAHVLVESGLLVRRTFQASADRYEEEFHDLLHFSTLEDAEMCLIRLDELRRKFHQAGDAEGGRRVIEVAQLGYRRAVMISRNRKVERAKRVEKEEVRQWFHVWLDDPDSFFDWLELRKQAPEFQQRFGRGAAVES